MDENDLENVKNRFGRRITTKSESFLKIRTTPHKRQSGKSEAKVARESLNRLSGNQEKMRRKPVERSISVPDKNNFIKKRFLRTQTDPLGKVISISSPKSSTTLTDVPKFDDQIELIEKFRQNPQQGFDYMVYAVDRSSKFFTPYALRVVSYKNIGDVYLTISANGVTRCDLNEITFSSLDEWEREYKLYRRLLEIKTFANYNKWKAFRVWKKLVRRAQISRARDNLEKRLFVCNRTLFEVFLEIKKMCANLESASFADVADVKNVPFFIFVENHFGKLEAMEEKLKEFRILASTILKAACLDSLLESGYTPDDSNITLEQTVLGKLGGKVRMPRDGILKMSYIDQANKRNKCKKLVAFIRMIDYQIVTALWTLLWNTFNELFDTFKIHSRYLPSFEELKNLKIDQLLEMREPEQSPYLIVDFAVKFGEGVVLEPTEETIWKIFGTFRTMWEDTLRTVKPLMADEAFGCFTRPLINNKIEPPLCGDPPDISSIITNDEALNNIKGEFDEILRRNFATVKKYSENFRHIYEFYEEDVNFPESTLRANRSIAVFREWCERYRNEEDLINSTVESQILGIFQLRLERFKITSLPGPNENQDVLKQVIPAIGKSTVDELLEEAVKSVEFLESEPVTTIDYVNYIKFVDQARQKIEDMESRLDYAKEIYDIMEEYDFDVPSEDSANYLGISVHFTTLRLAVDNVLESRDRLIAKFNSQIQKDITVLVDQIQLINNEITEPWLLDDETELNIILTTLSDLNNRLTECQTLASDYRSYQKTFKVEMTRFEILDQVINEVKWRVLLWESISQWDVMISQWYSMDFSNLDMEELNGFVVKNLKNIIMLEKGLPSNPILPSLKEKVEVMKDKLPIIGYLRIPNLKPRHWQQIEDVLNHKFEIEPETPLTLKMLEDLRVFEHPDELEKIASSASSEAGLELMIKKVEDAWRNLDFVILSHKESKDVFILGTLEEIQATLDDSNIIIQTVAASKYVAPIKTKVDDWSKRLNLMAKTLDAWQYCQMQWIYLEAIFSAPDIQRQLPIEAKLFIIVDKSWKDIMRKAEKMPLALENCTQPGLYEKFVENNKNLDQILKCLEAYLETKRIAFPRFFFLSNDELLEILAQTRNPHAVQRHLQKCFDAIFRLEFGDANEKKVTQASNDIIAMISPEGERVELGKGLKARGNVEAWLKKVEAAMFSSLKKKLEDSMQDFLMKGRKEVIWTYPSQIVLTVSQIFWAKDVDMALESSNPEESMKMFERKCFEDLNELAGLVRGELPRLVRDVIINLITVDVHARDTITTLVKNRVLSSSSFDWTKALRYYWDPEINNCLAKMSNAEYSYGYEYLGAQRRLVITPLTDKCYLCLMGALQLDLGGAPAGPAGTGKTETTKDLAKALAIQCVVFNCSEGLDYKMMGRFFSGLATSGAWCCFDEFNRIDIEVLSVIAQQLITIRNAKLIRAKEFMFEGRKIKLVMSCAAFITMNPGYAGRTELPDNLKSLFRPVSMMVPNYQLIAEVTLYSEGFESSKQLSVKMALMYQLCSEQLSQQDHYDFGMRAVKSVLVMAGNLKRNNPDKKEDLVLMKALSDSNLPKFLADDAQLFMGILGDLFPGINIPPEDYGILQEVIATILKEADLQPEECSIQKVIQLHETMIVRHGVMTVGPAGSGKSTILHTLKNTYTRLKEMKVENEYYKKVHCYVLNPKSVTMGELYGEVNLASNEWHDGLLGVIIRKACAADSNDHQWCVCDGPVDAVWIENMNTVLDDNKMLCLANSERIKLTPYVHMVFEVADLAQASPATVSRCGMVYVDPAELGWMPLVKTWLAKMSKKLHRGDVLKMLLELFENYVEKGLKFFKKYCNSAIAQVDVSKIDLLCALLETILLEPKLLEKTKRIKTLVIQAFVFSYMWSIGGNIVDSKREIFEEFVQEQFKENSDVNLPYAADLWDLYIDVSNQKMEPWTKLMPRFAYDQKQPFFEIIVPTLDTVRFGFIMQNLIKVNKPVLFTGETGVGKSVIAKMVLSDLEKNGSWVPIVLNFSAQTSSGRTQEILELKLDRKRKNVLGAPIDKRVCVFIDDVNMPKLDTYGAQPPIELLRQLLDSGGFYERDKMFWTYVRDVVVTSACAPPGGGRNPLSARFSRHFGMFTIPEPTDDNLKSIFRSIMRGFLKTFMQPIIDIGDKLINAAIAVYHRIAEDLLPTPEKSHYVFNLRDLSKCIQGVCQADPGVITEAKYMMRLFYHENLRVFHDRLTNSQDRTYFFRLLKNVCVEHLNDEVIALPEEDIIQHPPLLIFGDFLNFGAEPTDRVYEEIVDLDKAKSVLQEYLDDYISSTNKEMGLIFFIDAVEHLCRLSRILRSERGNGLLVGVGGMGKQSLTKLASHVNGYKCHQIEVGRGYDRDSWFQDLRRFYLRPGALAEHTTFLFTDTQIVVEEFLEDINNTLNSGEVPNLYEAEELEKAIISTRPAAKEAGYNEGNRDGIYQFFISRVRNHLHLMLCMSPVGDAFRRRCRMFPSLVNCCTIDWFSKWPKEALQSVAVKSIATLVPDDAEKVEALANICVLMHESVEDMTVKFFEEMRRRYYTTPSSYLDLLKLYSVTLGKKSQKIETQKGRIVNGLNKLKETNEMVAVMKVQLIELEPKLKQSSEEVSELMIIVTEEKKEADAKKIIVEADKTEAKKKAEETKALEAEARRDLEAAIPALKEAQNALESLNKKDIDELKVFNKPPKLVQFVMEAVCLLLGAKPDWKTAKSILADVRFLDRLMTYKKDDISDLLLKKLQHFTQNPEFDPDLVAKQSKVCKSICIWVRAIDGYAKISREVEPKRKRLKEAQAELDENAAILRQKEEALAHVERKIRDLQRQYDGAVKHLEDLKYNIELGKARLSRSGRLTSALADEEVRWIEEVKEFDKLIANVEGDTLIAAGGLAYLGAFTNVYRDQLINNWLSQCEKQNIVTTENFTLIKVLADPYEIRMWNTFGLPRDRVSTDNAILVTQAGRWPLMIDPQEQANPWIKSMEQENQLKVCKMTDSNFMRVLEACVRIGTPLLMQEVGEDLDPSLEPILLKQTFVQGGRMLIRFGDNDVEYDPNFKFYITTKMSNPHYLPEICIKVTIVNFTVTPQGLEDQLLADVVKLEKPELENMRNELIATINADKMQMKAVETRILTMLFTSEGNILDNEELVETLNESKETSAVIAARLEESETTEKEISIAREKYRSAANHGSILYFVVACLAEIDTMYQFSLKYFNQIIYNVIEKSEKSSDLQKRLDILYREVTLAVYVNISRGLFERHKIVYSFMLNIAILLNNQSITVSEWNFLLRGAGLIKMEKKPDFPTLTDAMWSASNYLAQNFQCFESLLADMFKMIPISIEDYSETINIIPDNQTVTDYDWNSNLTDIEKLMLLKSLKEEKLIFAIIAFVKKNLGQRFVESPMISLHELYKDISKDIPLIFVLCTGSDPFNAFHKFAIDMNFVDRYQSISLGQGQGPVAENLLRRGCKNGDWVFLQNCHLASSWMLAMENLIIEIAEDPASVHDDFRLFLSSMPSGGFPVSVLQNSVKVTNEPPKGLKANVKRALYDITEEFFETHELASDWRTMIFGICFFHSIIQERKKFGPLGWNIVYEFSDSDRECCLLSLKMFCQATFVPWDALIYTTGEIIYGGRITDNWDLRCLKTILEGFFSPKTLETDYKYSTSGIYYCPKHDTLREFKEFVENLPILEDPEIFGMHENANIVFQLKESKGIIDTIMEVQPKVGGVKGEKSNSDIVYELADSIKEKIALHIDVDMCNPAHLEKDQAGRLQSLSVVLIHEVERYNLLLSKIHSSINNLQKAIKGFVIMSDELENVFHSLLNNQVPRIWHSVNVYPSLKTLGNWIRDLEIRIDFIRTWLTSTKPISFWISGMSFPQGFITGMLQTYARKYNVPIDTLKLDFSVMDTMLDQEIIERKHRETAKEDVKLYNNLEEPSDGVLIHGLFIDAGRWDFDKKVLTDALKGEMNPPLPVVHVKPVLELPEDDPRYVSPLYKTSIRAGVLSTTGHSTNFVMPVLLPSTRSQSYWILKGTALLIQVTD